MPATCSIDDCGLPAIGECVNSDCDGPDRGIYCRSHMAGGGTCAACARRREQRRVEIEAAIDGVRRQIRMIARAMVAQRAAPDKRYFKATTTRTNWNGPIRAVEDPARDKYGWLIGEFEWRRHYEWKRPEQRTGPAVGVCRTYITADGGLVADGGLEGRPSALAAEPHARNGDDVLFWEQVLEHFSDIARGHGVELDLELEEPKRTSWFTRTPAE